MLVIFGEISILYSIIMPKAYKEIIINLLNYIAQKYLSWIFLVHFSNEKVLTQSLGNEKCWLTNENSLLCSYISTY